MIDENLYSEYPYYGAFTVEDRNFDPNKPRIKHILWNHYDWFEEMDATGKARRCVLDNVQRVLICNTIYLGYDAFECPKCHNVNLVCRKCHSRFCTSCGAKTQKVLAEKAQIMCVNVPHRHMVFTIPEKYRNLFRYDRSAMNLLFVAARNSICKMVNENIYRKEKRKQEKTGRIRNDNDNYYLYRNFKDQKIFGMIAALHTFGRDLKWNPHIHALVPEIVWNPKKQKLEPFNYYHYESLRKTWQYELSRLLEQHFGESFLPYKRWSYINQENGYYVHAPKAKEDNHSVEDHVGGCVNYMMRYASRPAMAESRILSYNNETDDVVWFYDDHKTNERITVKEKGLDLLKKMIIHIPDTGFRMIRYYGFYNQKEQELLNTIHEQLGEKQKIRKTKEERKKRWEKAKRKLRYRTLCLDSFNRDIFRCSCGAIMKYEDTYDPLEKIHNDRYYRRQCIDEMRDMQLRRKSPNFRA